MVEVAPIMSIPVDMTDMDEGGKKEVVPKRAEWSVDCPAGRMVNSCATVIILDLMAFRQSFYFFMGALIRLPIGVLTFLY